MDCELWSALPSFIALYLQPLIVSFHTHRWHSECVEKSPPLCLLPLTGLWVCVMFPPSCYEEAVVLVQDSVDIQGFPLYWISNWEMKYWHCSFTQYQSSLHIEVEWVWRTLKLDSIVTTRVHQPLSYLRSLTISDMPRGPCFLHHTEWFMFSPGSSKLCVFKGGNTLKPIFFHFKFMCHSAADSSVWVTRSSRDCF